MKALEHIANYTNLRLESIKQFIEVNNLDVQKLANDIAVNESNTKFNLMCTMVGQPCPELKTNFLTKYKLN